jgi:uncharacterized protein (DUF1778 family)
MMGRPPKPPKEVKSAAVRVRLTKAERARIDRAAKASGEDVSTWARAALLAAADQLLRKG